MSKSPNPTTAECEYACSLVEDLDDRHERIAKVLAEHERDWCLLRDAPQFGTVDDQRLLDLVREASINRIAAEIRRLAGLQVQASARRSGKSPPSGDALEEAIERLLRLHAECLRGERARGMEERLRRRRPLPGEGRRFIAWARRQRDRRDPVGDLARGVVGDREFPRGDFEAADGYLWRCSADSLAHTVLAEAWTEFVREELEAGR